MNMDESNLIETKNRKSMMLEAYVKEKEYMAWKGRTFIKYMVNDFK